LWGVSVMVFIFGILATFTRGAYVALTAGFMIGIIIVLWNARYHAQRLVMILVGMCISMGIFAMSPAMDRVLSIGDFADTSVSERVELWQHATHTIAQHPFTGVGLGNYPLTMLPHANYRVPYYAHNTYLDIMAETGIVAGIVWIFLLVAAIVRGMLYRTQPLMMVSSVSIMFFAIHSLFDTALFSVHILPLIMIILAIVVIFPLTDDNYDA
jgi:O-antigen ligase